MFKRAMSIINADKFRIEAVEQSRAVTLNVTLEEFLKGAKELKRLILLVPLPRLERGTPRSTIWCSNQLSYSGVTRSRSKQRFTPKLKDANPTLAARQTVLPTDGPCAPTNWRHSLRQPACIGTHGQTPQRISPTGTD